MRKAKLWIVALVGFAAAALASCSEELNEGPLGSGVLDPAGKPAVPDVSGEWAWSETQRFLLSADLAALIGIVPEGTHTDVTCHNSGTMVLDQDGAAFTGVAGQEGDCVTTGGQEFEFDIPFPFIEIVEGRVSGRTVHFGFSSPLCPYRGVLQFDGGDVAGIGGGGTGQCRPPFSLDGTPPFDQLAITSRWQAARIP